MKNKFKAGIFLILLGVAFFGNTSVLAEISKPEADVYLTVIKYDTYSKVSVTVPTLFAFAVNGTRETSSTTAISVSNGTLLLPNVIINLLDPDDPTSGYQLAFVGNAALEFKNYSTTMAVVDGEGNPNLDLSIREGLPVLLNAYIENTGDTPLSRGNWNVVADNREVTTDSANFKNYRLGFGNPGTLHQFVDYEGSITNRTWLNNSIPLEKPVEAGGYTPSGDARIPSVLSLPLDVEIGGVRGQYSQVEESVKAGKIVWTVELEN
ncbi:MAG: hypothetical protein ACRCU3_10525 [Eubacteriaceae bacterium]